MTPFAALGLAPAIARAAQECGYAAPTPVQSAAIPAALSGRDVLATAQTGSGKTAAFALPVLQQLQGVPRAAPRATRALVLVPTRELASQVGESMRALARHLAEPPKVAVVFGGVSINPQMMDLRGGAELIVATPGRLLDLADRNAVRLGGVAVLVLDEADRLLEAGFADELARVLALLPPRRQNLLFSATFPSALQSLAGRLLHEPVCIELAPEPAAARPVVEQHAVEVDEARRTPLLRHMIRTGGWTRVLVFVATRYASDHLADKLRRAGIAAAAFHADASQGARTRALAEFKGGRLQVLVATDLAARGIDVVQLPVVVNYDLPRSALDHLHRIGRTARAGAGGLAVSFIGADDEAHFRLIEKRQGCRVARERIPGFEPGARVAPAAPTSADGGVKGRRRSKKDKLREAAARGG
ncbi:MAG TPA: DEAD/DEAH box helicase [Albitalea sp.]